MTVATITKNNNDDFKTTHEYLYTSVWLTMITASIPWCCAICAFSEKVQLPRWTATADLFTVTGISTSGSQNILYSDDVRSLKAIGFCHNKHNCHHHILQICTLRHPGNWPWLHIWDRRDDNYIINNIFPQRFPKCKGIIQVCICCNILFTTVREWNSKHCKP